MVSMIKDIIPGSIDDRIECWEEDESENYRLTLLHKNRDSVYCFLSENIQEIKPEEKIDMGMTIAFSKKADINCHYDIIFHRKDIDNGYYYTFDEDEIFENGEKVIPFRYERELPSAIVDKNLKRKIVDYVTYTSDSLIELFEQFGKYNFLKSIYQFKFSKKWKDKKEYIKESRKSLKRSLTDLFREETSPSTFIHPISYKEEDLTNKTIFVKQRDLHKKLLICPLLAFMPYSSFNGFFSKTTIDKYKNRFGQTKEEEKEYLLNEFIIGHPKVNKGALKLIELLKHAGNISIYGAQTGIASLTYLYTPSIISYPMIFSASISGLTMMTNFIKSMGRDSSGVISTILDRKLFNKLE